MKEKAEKECPPPCNIKDWTLCLLALSIVWGFLSMGIILLMGWGAPLDPKDRLMMIQQVVNFSWAGAGMALGFYFGSSKSDSDKNKTISDLSSNAIGTGNGIATTTTTTPEGITTVKTEPVIKTDIINPAPVEVVNAPGTTMKTEPQKDN